MTNKQRLIAIPRGRDAELATLLVFAFIVFFLVVYGGASFLSGLVPYRIAVDFAFERELPFVPEASVVYLSMDLLVGLAPFVLRRYRLLFPFFAVLCVQTIVGAVFFVLLPVETAFAPRHASGLFSSVFAVADTMNMERNFLPSLHVAYAVTAALAFGKLSGKWAKVGFGSWALAIAASTILIHEHHLVDVFAGALLAWATMRWVHPLAARSRLADTIEVELRLVREMFVFGLRHPRYWLISLALYKASASTFSSRRILRSGFVFLQVIDDILDGDRKVCEDPIALTEGLVKELRQQRFGDGPTSFLARVYFHDLERIGGLEEGMPKTVDLIRAMQLDHRRVAQSKVLNERDLKRHLQQTFELSVDLMLLAGSSSVRAADVPSLIGAFAWCSVVRDLEEDLAHGLVNLPSEKLGGQVPKTRNQALRISEAAHWLQTEQHLAQELVKQADAELDALHDAEGVSTLRMFNRSIRRYAQRPAPVRAHEAVLPGHG